MGLLVLLGLVAAGVRFNDQLIGLTGDNAEYILLARALLLGERYYNAEYAWGYPAMLAPFLAVAGPGNILSAIPWMKLLTVLLYVGSLPLIYALFRLRHGAVAAFASTFLYAVNGVTLLYANDVMSEIPYIAASYGALFFWQMRVAPWARDREAPAVDWRRVVGAGVAFGLAYYFRSVALALYAGAALVLLWNRKVRAAALLSLLVALISIPWFAYSRTVDQPGYVGKVLIRDPYNPDLGRIASVGEFAGRLLSTGRLYVEVIFPNTLLAPPTPGRLVGLLSPLLIVLLFVGLAARFARGVELPELYILSFALMLFAWPWRADRFMLPIYPLALHYVVEGSIWVGRRLGGAAASWRERRLSQGAARAVVAILLIALALPSLWQAGVAGAENLRYLTGKSPPSGHTPDWQSYFAACRWLQANTPPDSVVMSRKSTLTTIYSSRPSVLIPLIAPEEYPRFVEENGVDYVIEDAFAWSTQTGEYLRPALRAHPDLFELVASVGSPVTRVWKVKR